MHHEIPIHITLIEPTISPTPIVTSNLPPFSSFLSEASVSEEVLNAYGGREYQEAQWDLSAVHLRAKNDKAGTLVPPEEVVRAIVEQAGRESGIKARRPVPEFEMGLFCGSSRIAVAGPFWLSLMCFLSRTVSTPPVRMYQVLPESYIDGMLVKMQRAAIAEKLEERRQRK